MLRSAPHTLRSFGGLRPPHSLRSLFCLSLVHRPLLRSAPHTLRSFGGLRPPHSLRSCKYTPTRFDGHQCELLLRIYEQRAGGASQLTPLLDRLRVGDTVEMRGPVGIHRYGEEGPGSFREGKKQFAGMKRVLMLAGGTGVTPMIQVANDALQNPADRTRLHIVLANTCKEDIMMKDELLALAAASAGQLRITFTLSRPPPPPQDSGEGSNTSSSLDFLEASMSRGTFDESTLEAAGWVPCTEEEKDSCMVLVCGPPGFNKQARALVNAAGYSNMMVW